MIRDEIKSQRDKAKAASAKEKARKAASGGKGRSGSSPDDGQKVPCGEMRSSRRESARQATRAQADRRRARGVTT